MKKFAILLVLTLVSTFMVACQSKQTLRILNWGEYLNPEVVELFEAEYNIKVIEGIADSNELFYSKIKSKTTAYDIVIPSDYMVEKMVQEDMLFELDYSLLTNYSNVTYMEAVDQIYSSMAATTLAATGETVDFKDYAVPYFWGTFGIIYNNRVDGLEESLNANGWDVFFEADNYFPEATRGMYDVAQFAYAASLMYLDENPNLYSETLLDQSKTAIETANFTEWGTDTLKRNVEADNLDMAFVYTGDYLDRMYIQLDEGRTLEEIQADFNIYIPETTMVFIDNMVIPNTSKDLDAAHKFINFVLRPEMMALNAESVGYAVPTEEAFDIIISHLDDEDAFYHNWAYANMFYNSKDREGTFYPLTSFDVDTIDEINTMIQVIRTE
ncbi:MAG: extracellular solute-binding protein [Tenericutes bacterium]|nr:extracellular solute-binding protein [Mycoplasmatota bacterium]